MPRASSEEKRVQQRASRLIEAPVGRVGKVVDVRARESRVGYRASQHEA
jgi:hypothetical protein